MFDRYRVEDKEGEVLTFNLNSATEFGPVKVPECFKDATINEKYRQGINYYISRTEHSDCSYICEGFHIIAEFNSTTETPWIITIESRNDNNIPDWAIVETKDNILTVKIPFETDVSWGEFCEYRHDVNNKTIAEDKMNEIIENSKHPIEYISAYIDGERIGPFCFGKSLGGGGPINIRASYYDVIEILRKEFETADKEFHPWFYDFDASYEINEEKAKAAFDVYFRKAMQNGVLFLPVKYNKLNNEKSSPILFSLIDKPEVYLNIDGTMNCIVKLGSFYPYEKRDKFKKEYGNVVQMTIDLKDFKSVSVEDYPVVVNEISELMKIYNEFVTSEYENKKNTNAYQDRHREAWANF